jgi:hypothetical protein
MLRRVAELLGATEPSDRRFPPTTLYNETWMLRLVIDWFDRRRPAGGLLTPAADARWYSEALLPSRFLRGAVNEGYTNADAVIGHFDPIGERGDIKLREHASQFVVVEAKMKSPLSSGTKHAPEFNQAARNVACMINTIDPKGDAPSTPADTRFIVLAPAAQIEKGINPMLSPNALYSAIEQRARIRSEGDREADLRWVSNAVGPRLLSGTGIASSRSWEKVIEEIAHHERETASDLHYFYGRCREYNRL